MRKPILLSVLPALVLFSPGDSQKKCPGQLLKGRLEVAGECLNYTIAVLEGKRDTSAIVPNWTDPATGKKYKNVFRLGNPCNFPDNIKAGEEFYFTVSSTKGSDCMVCMAHYPTPPKSLNIKVTVK